MRHLALAQRRQVDHRAQAAADEALDLLRAARLLARAASRAPRVWVARGSMPYSAVTQPVPLPFRNGGTFSSTLAVHRTLRVAELDQHGALGVRACSLRVKRMGRSWSADRSW